MDHLLLAPNASHVTSSPTVARDSITTLAVIWSEAGIHLLKSRWQIWYIKENLVRLSVVICDILSVFIADRLNTSNTKLCLALCWVANHNNYISTDKNVKSIQLIAESIKNLHQIFFFRFFLLFTVSFIKYVLIQITALLSLDFIFWQSSSSIKIFETSGVMVA